MCEIRDEKTTYNAPNIYVDMLVLCIQLQTHWVATSCGIIGIHLTVILATTVLVGIHNDNNVSSILC